MLCTDSLVFREAFDSADGVLLYQTLALCPVCAVRERRAMRWHAADVIVVCDVSHSGRNSVAWRRRIHAGSVRDTQPGRYSVLQ